MDTVGHAMGAFAKERAAVLALLLPNKKYGLNTFLSLRVCCSLGLFFLPIRPVIYNRT